MIPSLLKSKLAETYGKEFILPSYINLLKPAKEAYQGLEHDLQKAFFGWLAKFYLSNPDLYLMHAIPNGGKRDVIEGSKLKVEGVKAGIPDIFLPMAKAGWHGLYIELKSKANKPDEDQRIMMLMLDFQGYKVVCVNTLQDAIDQFSYYITEGVEALNIQTVSKPYTF